MRRPQGCPAEKASFLREEEPRSCWRCSGPSLANTGWLFPGVALAVAPEPFPREALTPASLHRCSEEERLVKGGSTRTEERPEAHGTESLSWSEHQGFFSGPPPSRVASFPAFPGTACRSQATCHFFSCESPTQLFLRFLQMLCVSLKHQASRSGVRLPASLAVQTVSPPAWVVTRDGTSESVSRACLRWALGFAAGTEQSTGAWKGLHRFPVLARFLLLGQSCLVLLWV